MGKEWSFAGRSSSKRGVGAETQAPSGCMCAVFQFFDFHPFHFPNINQQQQQASFKPPLCTSQDHTTVPKGAEAPRNSLESEDGDGTISSLSSKEEDFKIPKNIIQIKTSGGTRASGGNDLSSEISSSPGTKTPTLVARLMGLDLLPGAQSPSFSSSLSTPNAQSNVPHLHHLRHKQQQHVQTKHRNSVDSSDIAATRSLPETPRISSARRSDVDYHHRLSLQINKENMNLGEDLDLPRLSFSKRSNCDENNNNNGRSPSYYARQIAKQVKESVSRKVGQDITNTLKTREEIIGQFRSKKSHKTSSLKAIDENESNPVKVHSNTSYSPRLRLIDKHKPSTITTTPPSPPLTTKDQNILKLPPPRLPVNTAQPHLPRVLTTKPKPQAVLLPEQQEFHQNNKSVPKYKKAANEKFNSRLKRPPNKTEESFILRPTSQTRASDIKNTKTKKTHSLSSNLLNNINNVPNLLPVKTDPSPAATKITFKPSQVCDSLQEFKSSSSSSSRCSQLSSCSSQQRYKQEGTTTLATQHISDNKPNGVSSIIVTQPHHSHTPQPELHYITSILALNKQGTPLDPSLFHHLEHFVNDKDRNFTPKNELGHRWNRKLLFDLVDEVLVEIFGDKRREREKKLWFLKGTICCQCDDDDNDGLVERVWKRVGEFPRAKCEVLEDIDGLIEGMEREKDGEGIEEEGQGLVAEIEGNIWNTLVHETVMVIENLASEKLLYSAKIISVDDFDSF